MQGKFRPWMINALPIYCWSQEHQAWEKISWPLHLSAHTTVWLDLNVVVYGMIELHFEPSKALEIELCSAELPLLIHQGIGHSYTYQGHGYYPIILGQQVHRFIQLKVKQDSTLSSLMLWSHSPPSFAPCPTTDDTMQALWQGGCAVASLCWQDGLWSQPSIWPYENIYGVWLHGWALHRTCQAVEDWKQALHYYLQRAQGSWLEDSPMGTLWLLIALSEYYARTKDEAFFLQCQDQVKEILSRILSCCGHAARVNFPNEPEGGLWARFVQNDKEELLMLQQIVAFWCLSKIKHLAFHFQWVDFLAKIEHLLALREEFWLFPQYPITAALAILADLPDRRMYFLPTLKKYSYDCSSLEMLLIALALVKKGEGILAQKIAHEFWKDKTPLAPVAVASPLEDKQEYTIRNWDVAPIMIIDACYDKH